MWLLKSRWSNPMKHLIPYLQDDQVAYLLAADNVPGPLLTQLIDPSQPVLHTGNEFSRPRLALLASIWAHVHRSTPRSSTAPLVTPSAAEATAARGTGAPL